MAESDPHPLLSADPDLTHQWMREECATVSAQRQAREDGLVSTITQISSAALLAVPAVIFGSDFQLRLTFGGVTLSLGLLLFMLALIAALAEQYLSGIAYQRQYTLIIEYYQRKTTDIIDKDAAARVTIARSAACFTFVSAALLATVGLIILAGEKNGSTTVAPTSATTAGSPTAKTR